MPIIHEFRRGPNAVRDALAAAARFCAAEGVGQCPALAVIVEELVVNLVDYGAGTDDLIQLRLERDDRAIRMILTDAGPPFDPRTVPDRDAGPLPDPDRGGGAGLAIVRAWSRIELYTRINGRNVLHLAIPLTDLDGG